MDVQGTHSYSQRGRERERASEKERKKESEREREVERERGELGRVGEGV